MRLGRVRRSFLGSLEQLALGGDFDDWFPFDVVNLDFTALPFPRSQPPFNSTWKAIQAILRGQRSHGRGFELFLTFNATREPANEAAIRQLIEVVEQNFGIRPWSEQAFLAGSGSQSPNELSVQAYDKFLLVCLPKFIARLATDEQFVVKGLERFSYKRRPPWGATYSIVKFVLSLDPLPSPALRINVPPRHEIASQSYDELVRSSFESPGVDVDQVLQYEPGLRQSLGDEVASLLQEVPPMGA